MPRCISVVWRFRWDRYWADLPAGGMVSVDSTGLPFTAQLGDLVRHMILPVTILVLGAQPILIRHVKAAVAEALEGGFVRAAEAIFNHAAKQLRLRTSTRVWQHLNKRLRKETSGDEGGQ